MKELKYGPDEYITKVGDHDTDQRIYIITKGEIKIVLDISDEN